MELGPRKQEKGGLEVGVDGGGGCEGVCERVRVAVGIGKLKLAADAAGWVEEEEEEWQTRVGLTIEQRLSTSLAQPGPKNDDVHRGLWAGGGKLQDARDARLSRLGRAGEQCKWARFACESRPERVLYFYCTVRTCVCVRVCAFVSIWPWLAG